MHFDEIREGRRTRLNAITGPELNAIQAGKCLVKTTTKWWVKGLILSHDFELSVPHR